MRLFKVIFVCFPVLALMAAQQPDENEKLRNIENQIEKSENRRQDLTRQAEEAAAEITRLSEQLVALASRVQAYEEQATTLEADIIRLDADRLEKETVLETKKLQLMETLAALERLSQTPPELLLARPAEATDTVRSAGLLATVLPEIKDRADEIKMDISALKQVRSELERDRKALADALTGLNQDQRSMDSIRLARQEQRKRYLADADNEQARIAKLATEAKDLRSLLEKLETERNRRAQAAADAAKRLGKPSQERKFASLPSPSKSFSGARGNLPLPVRGSIVERFGAATDAGKSKGIRIATREGAQVIAPHDGEVVFAGPFRAYGQLLIIAHGEGYYTLLAGMKRIDGSVGQTFLAGEPVGVMGNATKAVGGATNASTAPELYVEIRRGGEPVDPVPWLQAANRKVS